MTDSTEKPKRKRRWLRFSLRSFLIVVAIFSTWVGWYVYQVEKQKAVVRWVLENGGHVTYDFHMEMDGRSPPNPQPPGPIWLHKMFGIDYFAGVVSINFGQGNVSNLTPLMGLKNLKGLSLKPAVKSPIHDLTPVTDLTNLEFLVLNNTQISDLTPLAGLTNLKSLSLNFAPINDLTPLANLKDLVRLELQETRVTEEEIWKLQEALPNCSIYYY